MNETSTTISREATLSDAQEMTLALLPIVPSVLSVLGSLCIIRLTYRQAQLKFAYDRLLLSMSVGDIIFTIVGALQPFLTPSDTSVRIWSVGNDQTCTALGVFYTMGTSSFWYSGALSVYFLCTVRKQIPDRVFSRKYERWIHVACIGWPLAWSLAGIPLGVYGEYRKGPGCSIPDHPLIAYGTLALPLVVMFLVVTINNMLIFFHVRKTISKSNNWRTSRQIRSARRLLMLQKLKQNEQRNQEGTEDAGCQHDQTIGEGEGEDSRNDDSRRSSAFSTITSSIQIPSLVAVLPSSSKRTKRSSDARLQLVAGQSFLYVASIYAVFLWPLVKGLANSISKQAATESDLYWILILQALLSTSQGVWSFLIYVRPRYLSHRSRYPDQSRWMAFQHIISVTRTPQGTASGALDNTSSTYNIPGANFGQLSSMVRQRFSSVFPSSILARRHTDIPDIAPLDSQFQLQSLAEENQHQDVSNQQQLRDFNSDATGDIEAGTKVEDLDTDPTDDSQYAAKDGEVSTRCQPPRTEAGETTNDGIESSPPSDVTGVASKEQTQSTPSQLTTLPEPATVIRESDGDPVGSTPTCMDHDTATDTLAQGQTND